MRLRHYLGIVVLFALAALLCRLAYNYVAHGLYEFYGPGGTLEKQSGRGEGHGDAGSIGTSPGGLRQASQAKNSLGSGEG
jgi:hypothetical protein